VDRNPWSRALIILGVLAVGLYLGGELWRLATHFADITILFFLAWFLAFILLPIVRFLDRYLRIGVAGAAALVYLALLFAMVTLLVLVIPLMIQQMSQLTTQLPTITAKVPSIVRQVQTSLDDRGIPVAVTTGPGEPSLGQQAAQLGSSVVSNSVAIAGGVASTLFDFVIVLVLSFYLVLDGDRFVAQVLAALPERYRDDARLFTESIDRSFGGFLRGTAIQAAILGAGTAIIMTFSGLGYALLASVFAAVIMVIPFIGPLLALIVPLAVALLSNLPTSQLLGVAVGLVVLQLLVMNVVAPKVMSQTVGLHPLLVFLALLVGIKEAGLAGAIFGVPVAAVIYASGQILLRRWRVIGSEDASATVIPTSVTRVAAEPPPGPPTIRIDLLGLHVGRVIGRVFHVRSG
jgi:predicted PurR-regulated permease PerM